MDDLNTQVAIVGGGPVGLGLKALCLFRFVNPAKEIRVAGGRELNLGSQQHLALSPANSLFVNGYLTTPGQAAADTHRMIEAHGFEVDDSIPPPA